MDSFPMKHIDDSDTEGDKTQEDETEAMNTMFEGHGPYAGDFNVDDLTHDVGSHVLWKPDYAEKEEGAAQTCTGDGDHMRVTDKELQSHRQDDFPHAHQPLQPLHRRRKGHHRHHERLHSGDDKLEEAEKEVKEEEETPKSFSTGDIAIEVGDPDLEKSGEIPAPTLHIPPLRRAFSIDDDDDETHEASPLLQQDTPVAIAAKSPTPTADDLIARGLRPFRPCIRSETEDTERSDDESKKNRVKFDIGSDALESVLEKKPKAHRKKRSRHHHHHSKHSYEDPLGRLRSGHEKVTRSDKHSIGSFLDDDDDDEVAVQKTTKDVVEDEKTEEPPMHVSKHISTHRFEDKVVPRRRSTRLRTTSERGRDDEAEEANDRRRPVKKDYDHHPHEVFVELSELSKTPIGGYQWKETARWIKYEEDVEGADDRWGKPHIAFLNFNALFSLRKGLERGAILLDLDEPNLHMIAARVVDHMVACDQIPPEERDPVLSVLLLQHKHAKYSGNTSFRRVSSQLSSKGSRLQLSASSERLASSMSADALEGGGSRGSSTRRSLANLLHTSTYANFTSSGSPNMENGGPDFDLNKEQGRDRHIGSMDSAAESDSELVVKKRRGNHDLLKKLPDDVEATTVLVGPVDFLKHPTIAFVRLAHGMEMENFIEVPIPVRFIFVLLGPVDGDMDYHEVGRAISTLMSDKHFHEVAYKAHSRGQLLAAINDFLSCSVVFPPSDWKHKDLVPLEDIHAKTQMMRRKTELKAQKKLRRELSKEADGYIKLDEDTKEGKVDLVSVEGGSPPPPEPRDPLKRTGKLFHGLIQDAKIRYSKYPSDFKDGLNIQVLSACIFIFFAALSPAITFGGMYSDLTLRLMGVGETLLVSCINGLIFGLFAAQPILIVGATGPLMIFDISLYQFCDTMDLDFLSIRVWVGIWILIFGLLVAAFELVFIVKKFTRFTEEIFSTLVCIIFIYGAFEKLGVIFSRHPLIGLTKYNITVPCADNWTAVEEDVDFLTGGNYSIVDAEVSIGKTLLLNTTGEDLTGDEAVAEGSLLLENQPNTALMSAFLMIGTFLIAWKLKKFRNAKFLGRSARRALGDFGVPLAIFLMVLLDFCIHDTYTDKLSMPSGLRPTAPPEVRGWFISPFGVIKTLPVWAMIVAAPAALLLFVLIFLEENICHLILLKPERCLKKGSGFHLDIVLSCLINTISGVLGAPFMGPACVRTIAHMSALTVMSSNVAPGESPKIVGCIEQRITPIFVSVFIGLSVMLYAVLNQVPVPVLLGIFLYMGVSATAGIQLLERTALLLMPVKHHPNVPYVKKVRTRKMHLFTIVQIGLLVILWIVKGSPAALAIPFVLLCLIPIRLYLLPHMFSKVELIALDGANQVALMEAHEDEPDFYETAHNLGTQIETKHQHET